MSIWIVAIIMIVMIGFMFNKFAKISVNHRRTMEHINIKFIRELRELHSQFGTYGYDNNCNVTYLVPLPFAGTINEIIRRKKLCLFRHEYDHSKTLKLDKSYYSVTVTKQQFFYMQLRKWIETEDKVEARKAMDYLGSKRELP